MIAVAALALLLPLAASAPAAAATSTFFDADAFAGVACVSATTCYTVGQYSNLYGAVMTLTNGSGSNLTSVPSTHDLGAIACPGGGTTCYAVGYAKTGYDSFVGAVLKVTAGTPGSATQVRTARRRSAPAS